MAQQLFTIEVKGLPAFRKLINLVDQAADPSRLLDEISAVLLNRIRTRFLNETDPDGARWPESNAARRRREQGRGGGTLFDTGTLFNSIQAFRRGDGERAIGTDVPYAPVHQFGLEGQEQRVFLGFSNDDINLVNKLIIKRLNDKIG